MYRYIKSNNDISNINEEAIDDILTRRQKSSKRRYAYALANAIGYDTSHINISEVKNGYRWKIPMEDNYLRFGEDENYWAIAKQAGTDFELQHQLEEEYQFELAEELKKEIEDANKEFNIPMTIDIKKNLTGMGMFQHEVPTVNVRVPKYEEIDEYI